MTKTAVYRSVSTFSQHEKGWRWPSFKPSEVACKDGSIMIDTAAMDALQALRNRLGAPIVLTSAYRSPQHNQRVGGAPRSRHMLAEAFDIVIAGHDPLEVELFARECGFHGIGRYPDQGFIHVDIRPEAEAATWGPDWPYDEDAELAPPPPPLPSKPTGFMAAISNLQALAEASRAQSKFGNPAKEKARARL